MFMVTCSKCDKQLHLPDTMRGKHVRCAGCQAIVLAAAEPTTDTPLPQRAIPRRSQPEPHALETTPYGCARPCAGSDPRIAMRQLPGRGRAPTSARRQLATPGFVCAMCRTEMRQPGTAGNYYAAVFLGVIIALLGLGLAGVAFKANRAQVVGGGLALGVLGLAIAAWGRMQARRPVPTGAERAPARFGFWVAVLAIGCVLLGGGVFGLIHLAQELLPGV